MKHTKKFLAACTILAAKYDQKLTRVLANETSHANVYLELKADGLIWHVGLQAWVKEGSKTFKLRPKSQIRSFDIYGRSKSFEVKEGKLNLVLTESPLFLTGLSEGDVQSIVSEIKKN